MNRFVCRLSLVRRRFCPARHPFGRLGPGRGAAGATGPNAGPSGRRRSDGRCHLSPAGQLHARPERRPRPEAKRDPVRPHSFMAGVRDALTGQKPKWSAAELQNCQARFEQEMRQKMMGRMQQAAVKNQKEADAFLAKNAQAPASKPHPAACNTRSSNKAPARRPRSPTKFAATTAARCSMAPSSTARTAASRPSSPSTA